jgi:glycerol-3-phosphate acyltransferase PlsY
MDFAGSDVPFQVMIFVGIASYLLGAIPFGIVVAKVFGLGNLREIGSGNIGTTNVLRTGSKPAAALTLILDSGKGAVAVIIARMFLGEDVALFAGFCTFFGHLYPIWLKFQGGKGVATFLGTLLAISFSAGFAACMTWLAVALFFRYSSLAALVSVISAVGWIGIFYGKSAIVMVLVMAIFVWVRHKENIMRLLLRNETKIAKK